MNVKYCIVVLFLLFLSILSNGQEYKYPLCDNKEFPMGSDGNLIGTVKLNDNSLLYGYISYNNKMDALTIIQYGTNEKYAFHYSKIKYFYSFKHSQVIESNYYFPMIYNFGRDIDFMKIISDGEIKIFSLERFDEVKINNKPCFLITHQYYYYNNKTNILKKINNFYKEIYPLMFNKKQEIDKYLVEKKINKRSKIKEQEFISILLYYNKI